MSSADLVPVIKSSILRGIYWWTYSNVGVFLCRCQIAVQLVPTASTPPTSLVSAAMRALPPVCVQSWSAIKSDSVQHRGVGHRHPGPPGHYRLLSRHLLPTMPAFPRRTYCHPIVKRLPSDNSNHPASPNFIFHVCREKTAQVKARRCRLCDQSDARSVEPKHTLI